MTVGAWLTAYLSRMPGVNAPGQVTVLAMLAMVFVGGVLAGRYSPKGILGAVLAGAVSGLLDILILGSLIKDMNKGSSIAPAAATWVTGSIVFNAIVAGVGGVFGRMLPSAKRAEIRWPQVFALVLVVATLPLITAGGLVTAFHAGLAVPDWPQSYGYNMFLFPLSQMQSNHGNFYEHAHRLMGSLVGFTALTLAIYVSVAEWRRPWVVALVWGIGVCVAIQAVLGGLRVTEKSTPLAVTHGVFAQLVFAAMACLVAVTSRAFVRRKEERSVAAGTDRTFTSALVGMLVVQLLLGAVVRHTDSLVLLHIVMATLVAMVAVGCGFRAWGIHGGVGPVKKAGVAVLGLVSLQLILGIVALAFRSGPKGDPTVGGAILTTAHQANGAVLLATAAVLWVWVRRLLAPVGTAAESPAAGAAVGAAS
jgi:cytochrome c oxidase assembly protein subunit 15